jgi:hypothetical protein
LFLCRRRRASGRRELHEKRTTEIRGLRTHLQDRCGIGIFGHKGHETFLVHRSAWRERHRRGEDAVQLVQGIHHEKFLAEHDEIGHATVGQVEARGQTHRVAKVRKRVPAALGNAHGDRHFIALHVHGARVATGILVGTERTAKHPAVSVEGAVALEVAEHGPDLLHDVFCGVVLAWMHENVGT